MSSSSFNILDYISNVCGTPIVQQCGVSGLVYSYKISCSSVHLLHWSSYLIIRGWWEESDSCYPAPVNTPQREIDPH